MNIRIFLKSPQKLQLPINYNYHLLSAIYTLIDTQLNNNFTHQNNKLKLLKISPLVLSKENLDYFNKESSSFKFNEFAFFDISSIDPVFINILSEVLIEKATLKIGTHSFIIHKVENNPIPNLIEDQYWSVNSISPLLVKRVINKTNNKLVYKYLTPNHDELFKLHISQNLIHKFNRSKETLKFNKSITTKDISIDFINTFKISYRYIKTEKVSVTQNLILKIKAPIEIQHLIHNLGLGNKNHFGFGDVKPLTLK